MDYRHVRTRRHVLRALLAGAIGFRREWLVTTYISLLPGRSVGIGAVVHCSLANYMIDCVVPDPGGIDGAAAVDGRILHLKITRPETPHTWHFVGVYQHVARSTNIGARNLLRATLHGIIDQASKDTQPVVILGDFNSAPPRGRWGYSRWSATFKEDSLMETWVRASALTEVAQTGKLIPTWKSNAGVQKAVLDRVFVSQASCHSMMLSVIWCQPLIVFDHALLLLRIPHSSVGNGYAGACRPVREFPIHSRCQVNLTKWKQHVPLWQSLLCNGLQLLAEEQKDSPPDPFEALKQGELLADTLARALAPKYIPKEGDVRRAYSFAGNRQLFRELNYLGKARVLVRKILSNDANLLRCPHRVTRLTIATARLTNLVRKTGHPVPVPLEKPPLMYFLPEARAELHVWMESVAEAIAVRKAAVQDSYAKARFHNLQNLRRQHKKSGGVLDKRTIQAALGKSPPRQRMWGISGTVILGAQIQVRADRQGTTVVLLRSVQGVDDIVYLTGSPNGLTLWFKGPRAAGDFISHWCARTGSADYTSILPLRPPGHYVAIRPDDILAVQEWYTASEGMD